MARKVKFSVTMAGLLKQAAVLILLSVTVEGLQCYWCGPLADQVHRSQRAPSCDTLENHVTACDPGYMHCAVVASSPPFVESRYCVKFYQDECYTLFCNTTNTYRMTCPCRGELCNGQKTEREIEAFASFAKAISKPPNNRIKKRNTMSTKHFVNSIKDKMTIVQGDAENISKETFDSSSVNKDMENDISDTLKIGDLKNETIDMEMQSDQPKVEMAHNSSMKEEKNDDDKTKLNASSEQEVDEIPEGSTEKSAKSVNKNVDIMTTDTASHIEAAPTMSVEKNANNVNPSMTLPTAEALQQNSMQMSVTSEKPIEQTTMETTFMTTFGINTNMDIMSTNKTRNMAKKIFAATFVIINCFIVNLIL